jgi:capsular exopolysaccharide synthesis family protein
LRSQRLAYEAQLEELDVDTRLSDAGVALVREARYGSQVDPRPRRTMVLALAAGLLLGAGAAITLTQLDRRVRSRTDLERAVPGTTVLGEVPVVHRRHSRELRPGSFSPRVLEAYRTLRANVQLRSRGLPLKVLMVTSPRPGDGKTTTAVNLAASMGFSGRQVVLVDGDLRAPRLAESLGIDHPVGLTDVLLGADLASALVPLTGPGIPERAIWVLPSGRMPPNPSELMAGRRLEDVMEQLRAVFSYVVVDTPPLLVVSDPGVLMRVVDGVVVVTRAERSDSHEVAEALERVARGPSTLLGVVLNASRERPAQPVRGLTRAPRARRRAGTPAFEPQPLRAYRVRPGTDAQPRVATGKAATAHPRRSDVQRTGKE